MKTTLRSSTLLTLGCWLSSTLLLAQSHALQNIQPVTTEGEYSTPVWSPDGRKLLFTEAHNDELFVVDLTGERSVKKLKEGAGIGYLANWSEDSEHVIYREHDPQGNRLLVKSIDLGSGRETVRPDVHPDYLKQASRASRSAEPPLMVYINRETLKLEAKRGLDGTPWVITPEAGPFYQPLVSPDERSVVVHEGAHMYLYSIAGKGSRKDLGIGLATSWQPDGQGVLTFEDRSTDGHTITASELFFIDQQRATKTQLTSSSDRIEMWGDISPDGQRIAFSDEKSGRIFVADLTR